MKAPTDGGIQERKPVVVSKSFKCDWDLWIVSLVKRFFKKVKGN
jgi:hypothetical protein